MAKKALQLKNDEIKVSVLCTTYNHEHCLRKCLDNMLSQKTNFKYEIIVHDDASTDKTQEVIKEYVEKYPDIIVPILQTENQYSKDVKITENIMFPISKGKYIALCEGDDYWCDDLKLQRQFDFMENNPDFIACFHNTICHDLLGKAKDKKFNSWKKPHELTPEDIFLFFRVHTSSYFARRDVFKKPKLKKNYWFGDFVMLTNWLRMGRLMSLPYVMSVRNVNNYSSATTNLKKKGSAFMASKLLEEVEYLDEYNNLTCKKYDNFVTMRKEYTIFRAFYIEADYELKNAKNAKEYRKILKGIKRHEYYSIGKEVYKYTYGHKIGLKLFIKTIIPFWLYKLIINRKNK